MTELSDYIRCVSGPQEESLKRRISELAQSNRRLREGLEEAADTLDWVPAKKLTATEAIYLNKKRAAARKTLKDNGHG